MTGSGSAYVWLGVAVLLTVVIGANAQMAYLAITTQPACVPHLQAGETADPTRFSAAKSSC